jgi:hypothetical protein
LVLQHVFLLFLPALLLPVNAQAENKDPTAIVEIGGAGEWDPPASSSFGPSAAVEFTPIKEWLEIEAGVAPMFNGGRPEWDTDLLFKSPSPSRIRSNSLSALGRSGRSRRAAHGDESSSPCAVLR